MFSMQEKKPSFCLKYYFDDSETGAEIAKNFLLYGKGEYDE